MAQRFPIDNPIFYDAEIFPGWWEFGLKYQGKVYQFRSDIPGSRESLKQWIGWSDDNGIPWVGFNSNHYDDKVLGAAVDGIDPYEVSVDIIQNDPVPWKYEGAVNSIDLMRILPGFMSLKKLGVCLGWKKLQELPVRFDVTPDAKQREVLSVYNINDLDITELLYNEIYDEIKLRQVMSEQYDVDIRSQGEATMAETILLHELKERGDTRTKKLLNSEATRIAYSTPVVVPPPFWWGMVGDKLPIVSRAGDRIFSTEIPITADGKLSNTIFKNKLMIGDRFYQMGVGGLHSIDGPGAWIPTGDQRLLDIDVTSYYPTIILSNKLYPRVWGPIFLDIYKDIVDRRVAAKRAEDKVTADVLKIAANGTFGKTASVYSALFDPQMFGSITLYGQLSLLALIEIFSQQAGIYVCSANTDGITIMAENEECERVARELTYEWERQTQFTMEWNKYLGLYQRDVSNYIAIKADGSLKAKGVFLNKWPDLRHIPSGTIIATGVQDAIVSKRRGIIRELVEGERDINQFILAHAADGAFKCHWRGQEQGKIVRWYWGLEGDQITKVHPDGRVQQVPRSEHAVSVPDLPEDFPTDIDYERYIKEAEDLLDVITQPKIRGMNQKAAELRKWRLNPAIVEEGKLSKAGAEWGKTDFTSMRPNESLGVKTGNGIMARVRDGETELLLVDRTKGWPAKTRDLVERKHGFTLYYGARLPVTNPSCPTVTAEEFEQWYTDGELKKVRGG